MVRPRGAYALDWKRYARWCGFGSLVMFIWLLAPVVRCTFGVFRDTPIGELDQNARPSDADRGRVEAGEGFVGKFVDGAKSCYRRTPLLSQEPWKTKLLVGFAAAALALWFCGFLAAHRRRSIG